MADCDRDPASAYRVNLDGTVSVLEAIRAASPKTRLLFASTAQVYQGQDSEPEAPWSESRRLLPQNLYARTKRAAEAAIQAFCADHGLSSVILRLFNHAHFTQSPAFFLPHLHQSLVRGERTIPVGNLDLWRDIGSLQDLLAAIHGVLTRLKPAEGESEIFNVCSGNAKKLADVAAELARQMGIQAAFEPQASRIRPAEPLRMEGDSSKLQKALNWSPQATDSESLIRSFLRPL